MIKNLFSFLLTLGLGLFVFGQTDSLVDDPIVIYKDFVSSVDKYDTQKAEALEKRVSDVFNQSPSKLDFNLLPNFRFYQGKLAFIKDLIPSGIKLLQEANGLQDKSFFSVLDRSKKPYQTVYFLTKEEAENFVSGFEVSTVVNEQINASLKEKTLALLGAKVEELSQMANDNFQIAKYLESAKRFSEIDLMNSTFSVPDLKVRFNEARSYQRAEEFKKAIEIYEKLLDAGYNGEHEFYVANNKFDNRVTFTKTDFDKAYNSFSSFSSFRIDKIKLSDKEIYKNLIFSYFKKGDLKKALEVSKKATEKYPTEKQFTKYKAAFITQIAKLSGRELSFDELIEISPTDPANYYNKAIEQFDRKDKHQENINLFTKAIDLDISTPTAYIDLVLLYLEDDKELKREINKHLGPTKEEQEKHEELTEKRKLFYSQTIMPILEKASAKFPENPSIQKYFTAATRFISKQ